VIANVALSVLDEHFAASRLDSRERAKRRRRGLSNYRLVRYADDWYLAVSGTREQAEALRAEAGEVLSTMGLRLSPEKTLITHIDEGLDFLGWRIQRHRKRGTTKRYVYNYPAKKALRAILAKVKALCWQDTNLPLAVLLHRLNSMLRGWTAYFRYGCSSRTFSYVRAYLWQRVFGWMRRKKPEGNLETTPPPHQRRMVARREQGDLIQPGRGRHPTLLIPGDKDPQSLADRCVREHPTQRGLWRTGCPANGHVRFGRRPGETHQ
jgi:group II intron maturase/reverse transcriptase-like protein